MHRSYVSEIAIIDDNIYPKENPVDDRAAEVSKILWTRYGIGRVGESYIGTMWKRTP